MTVENVFCNEYSTEDAPYTFEYDGYYKILPQITNWKKNGDRVKDGKPVQEGFAYTSDNNAEWKTIEALRAWINDNREKIGKL